MSSNIKRFSWLDTDITMSDTIKVQRMHVSKKEVPVPEVDCECLKPGVKGLAKLLRVSYKGGPNSGNHDHAGRPGQVGGSGSGGGSTLSGVESYKIVKQQYMEQREKLVAARTAEDPRPQPIKEPLSSYLDTDYFGSPYSFSINNSLRGGNNPYLSTESYVEQKAERCVHDFQDLSAPLQQDTIVYRSAGGHHTFVSDLVVGDVIQDKGFVSTTMDHEYANGWKASSSDRHAIMEIRIPKGTKVVIPIEGWEDEVLLGPGTKFRVTGTETETDSLTRLEVVGD